ncbi:MAG: hypothetical protein ACQETK_06690 [Pseudomonadota bacterium]
MFRKLRLQHASRDHQFTFSLLMFASGVVLVLQGPQVQDSTAELLSSIEYSSPTQVMEMRPQSPPPSIEGDQALTEEPDEAQTIAILDRDEARTTRLRERPQRPSGGE